ncbi:hypothetical protein [Streptomyces sp. CAU 1734]
MDRTPGDPPLFPEGPPVPPGAPVDIGALNTRGRRPVAIQAMAVIG